MRVLKLQFTVAGLSPRLVACKPVDSDQALVTEEIVKSFLLDVATERLWSTVSLAFKPSSSICDCRSLHAVFFLVDRMKNGCRLILQCARTLLK